MTILEKMRILTARYNAAYDAAYLAQGGERGEETLAALREVDQEIIDLLAKAPR